MPLTTPDAIAALAALGTRLRALHGASPEAIAAELAAVAAEPAPDTSDIVARVALATARDQFVARAHALLQEAAP